MYRPGEENIENGLRGNVNPSDWREILADLNRQNFEVPLLTMYAERVSKALPGAWSVDFMWTERGWFLIDMAIASRSWHEAGCPEDHRW